MTYALFGSTRATQASARQPQQQATQSIMLPSCRSIQLAQITTCKYSFYLLLGRGRPRAVTSMRCSCALHRSTSSMHHGTRYKLRSSCQTGLLLLQLACLALLFSYEQGQSSTCNSSTSRGCSSSSGCGHSEAPGPSRGGTAPAWLQGERLIS